MKISIHGYFFVRVWRNRVFTDISIVRQFEIFLYTDIFLQTPATVSDKIASQPLSDRFQSLYPSIAFSTAGRSCFLRLMTPGMSKARKPLLPGTCGSL